MLGHHDLAVIDSELDHVVRSVFGVSKAGMIRINESAGNLKSFGDFARGLLKLREEATAELGTEVLDNAVMAQIVVEPPVSLIRAFLPLSI